MDATPTTIKTRFPGTCRTCGERFGAGTRIVWIAQPPRSLTFHVECYCGEYGEPRKESVPTNLRAAKIMEVESKYGWMAPSSGRWCLGCGLPKDECDCGGEA